ncbi:hypothetical protein N9109_00795 [bacterium]|nr:hypothetical protein [bacterium]
MKFLNKIALAATLALASCVSSTPPTQYQIDNTEIGPAPTKERAIALAEQYLDNSLKDPLSKQVTYGEFGRGWYRPGLYSGIPQGKYIAWYLEAFVNAKNSYGGYTGAKRHAFYFKNDKLVCVGTPITTYTQYGPTTSNSIIHLNGGGTKVKVGPKPTDRN